jgi:hypothetical protein
MATQYNSAASWSKKIDVAADGTPHYLIQTIAAIMGIGVDTVSGTITVHSTLGTPDQIAADTCTWTAVTLAAGEGVVTMPVAALRVTGAGGAVGTVMLIQ